MAAGNGVCNTVYLSDPAVQLVGDAWTIFRGYAEEGYQLASDQIEAINNFTVTFHTWDGSFQADGELNGFIRPARPELPTISAIDLSGTIPDAPSVAIAPITLDPAPAEPTSLLNPPDLSLTVREPEALDAERPGSAPDMEIPDAPEVPVYDVIAAPTLTEIALPDVPELEITEFAETVPEFTAPPPSGTIGFTETEYVSVFLTSLKTKLSELLAGSGLPAAVEAALFGRAADREDVNSLKVTQEVREEFAARGFDAEPNGLLAKRLLEVRQNNRNKRSELSREVYIKAEDVAIENMRFAVTNGIQLEGQLLQAHLAIEERKFQLAVQTQQAAIAVFNAYVGQYNAAISAFNARIAAYQAFIEGVKARVNLYQAQVDAAKVAGEINTQRVETYKAQIQADVARAQAYSAQVEGFRARIEAEKAKIDGYRSEVDAYKSFVDAYRAEWDAEKTRIEAEAQRGRLYESLVNGYATRVQIWQTKGEARIQENRANLTNAQAFIQQHEAQVRTVLGRLEAVRTVVQAQSAQSDAIARMYQADASVESTAVDADTRAYQAITAREQARLEILLKDAALQIQQLQANASLLLRGLESSAQASSQLSASAFSAVNFSAGLSNNVSRSEACGTSFSYSGEISDA